MYSTITLLAHSSLHLYYLSPCIQVVTEGSASSVLEASQTLTSLLTRLVPEKGLDSQNYLCTACKRPIGVSESLPPSLPLNHHSEHNSISNHLPPCCVLQHSNCHVCTHILMYMYMYMQFSANQNSASTTGCTTAMTVTSMTSESSRLGCSLIGISASTVCAEPVVSSWTALQRPRF